MVKENFLVLLLVESTEPLVATVTCTEFFVGGSVENNKMVFSSTNIDISV